MSPEQREVIQRFRLDPGVGVALLLATCATWPFLTRPSLPTFTDAEHHVYRTYEVLSAWQQGVPYLRWAPDLFYGYPIFNYYAPLAYYLGAAYGWFFGGPVAGVKFVFVLAAYLGAVGIYMFARDEWGAAAGVVSAAAFALSPYIVYMDPHARGALPESLALALAPWALWAFSRLSRAASLGHVVIAALILATLLLSHNLLSFIFIGMLSAWLAWDLIVWPMLVGRRTSSSPGPRRVAWGLGAAFLLGTGLSAFMWLPAIVERGAVQFQNAFAVKDYGFHFVGAGEMFAPASLADVASPDLHDFKFRLGIAQWALGALGLLSCLRARPRRGTALFFALVAVVCVGLGLPASAVVWNRGSPLTYLQFPWRLLGPAAVAVGLLAGAATHWAESLPWPSGGIAFGLLAVAGCIATAMPLLDPLPWSDFGPVTPRRMFTLERSGVWGVGTTHDNEFLPVGVRAVPGPRESLLNSYDAGLVDKVDRASLPGGTQVTVLEHGSVHDRFQVTAPADFALRAFTFYFPGWTAYVDGVRTPITPADPEGWITVSVPAGTHEVLLRFEDTPPRWLGWMLSGEAGLVLLGLALRAVRIPLIHPQPEALAWRYALALAGVVLVGMGVRYRGDRASWWRAGAIAQDVPGAQRVRFERLENNIALLAFDLPQAEAKPGGQVPLTLYWQALAPVPLNLSVFVHFLGPDGQLWGQSDKLNPVDLFPTSRWPLNRYMRDEHLATLRPDAPPGEYKVVAGLWDRYTGVRMHGLDANGAVTDRDGIVLTTAFSVRP